MNPHQTTITDDGRTATCTCGWRSTWHTADGSAYEDAAGHRAKNRALTRPKYRVHVWKDPVFRYAPWTMGVWQDGSNVVVQPNAPIGFPTHAEAVTAGLAWAGELNAREKEEA